jgi:LmbE family N-acetylglucosaminyl deacetylase
VKRITLYRKIDDRIISSTRLADVFHNWQDKEERWLFVAAHDDDVVIGGGLMLQKAGEEGVPLSVMIVTDGRMGYCKEEERDRISEIRKREATASFEVLEVKNVFWLDFPDCDLNSYLGRRLAKQTDPCIIARHTGLQNAFTHHIRNVQPTRIFLPSNADYHPDHKMTYQEVLISVFHACGEIWPELGSPCLNLPQVYEMPVYHDLWKEPDIKIEASPEYFERKLLSIGMYKSQKQYALLVENLKKCEPVEYFRDIQYRMYSPKSYQTLF